MRNKKIVFFSCVLLMTTTYAGATQKSKLLDSLNKAAEKWGRDNNIPQNKVRGVIWEIYFGLPGIAKSGLAPIDTDLYIILNDSHNSLLIDGQPWIGKTSDMTEVVVLNGRRVTTDTDLKLRSDDLTTILFCPDEVRLVNYSSKSACRYLRSPTLRKQ